MDCPKTNAVAACLFIFLIALETYKNLGNYYRRKDLLDLAIKQNQTVLRFTRIKLNPLLASNGRLP